MKMIYATPLTRYVIVTYFALIVFVRTMSITIKQKAYKVINKLQLPISQYFEHTTQPIQIDNHNYRTVATNYGNNRKLRYIRISYQSKPINSLVYPLLNFVKKQQNSLYLQLKFIPSHQNCYSAVVQNKFVQEVKNLYQQELQYMKQNDNITIDNQIYQCAESFNGFSKIITQAFDLSYINYIIIADNMIYLSVKENVDIAHILNVINENISTIQLTSVQIQQNEKQIEKVNKLIKNEKQVEYQIGGQKKLEQLEQKLVEAKTDEEKQEIQKQIQKQVAQIQRKRQEKAAKLAGMFQGGSNGKKMQKLVMK